MKALKEKIRENRKELKLQNKKLESVEKAFYNHMRLETVTLLVEYLKNVGDN